MLPTDESGGIASIENVFHSLNTRLTKIKNNKIDLGELYSGYGYKKEESISEIEDKINGYHPQIALNNVKYSLKIIIDIHELMIVDDSKVKSGESLGLGQEYYDIIDNELSFYKSNLEKIQEQQFLRLATTESIFIPNVKKIKLTITVEQLAALLYFLNNEKIFRENDSIFRAHLTQICRAIITIFSQPDGSNISFDHLYNSVSSFKESDSIISFWKEKFILYFNHSTLLLNKIGE